VPPSSVAVAQVLVRVRACGVCSTDLHLAEGELPPRRSRMVPGHEVVGEVVRSMTVPAASGPAPASASHG
jgi:propanol-preferring alcohol dehydrogenase